MERERLAAGATRTARRVAWTLTGVCALALGTVLFALDSLRQQQTSAAREATLALVQSTEEMTLRTIELIDARLQGLAEVWSASSEAGLGPQDWMHEALAAKVRQMGYVRAIWMLDAQGKIVHDSDTGNLGLRSADRAFFTVHLGERPAGATAGATVSAAVLSRTTGTWFVPVSRAIRNADGSLRGVIVAALEPTFFAALWQRLSVGAGGSISLYSGDGRLLVRSPAGTGTPVGAAPPTLPAAGPEAPVARRAAERTERTERIVTERAVRGHPQLVLAVDRTMHEVLRPWRGFALLAVSGWATASGILGLLGLFLVRELRSRRLSERQLEALARLALEDPNPILTLDAGSRVLYANRPGQRLQQAIAATQGLGALVAQAPDAPGASTRELDLPDRSFTVTSVRLPEGGHVNVYATDITARRQAELGLQAQLQRTDLLNRITRAIGDRLDLQGVLEVAADSVLAQLPADWCAVLMRERRNDQLVVQHVGRSGGPAVPHVVLQPGSTVALLDGELLRDIDGAAQAQAQAQAQAGALGGVLGQQLTDAGLHAAVLAPLKLHGEVFGALLVCRFARDAFSAADVAFLHRLGEHVSVAASQARLYEDLQRAYDQLRRSQLVMLQQERLRALGRMAGGVAHDINNAMSPVALYTESLLESEPGLSERARRYLQTIQRAIDDVTKTVARMREASRGRDPGAGLQAVQLNDLVPQVLELTRARWGDALQQAGAEVQVRSDLDPALPPVLAVVDELRDALSNLVLNAIDAMPAGGTLSLSTRLVPRADGAAVQVAVQDDGVGMDEQTLQHCLEPFFTTKGERGTGLGLSMVYAAMQRHGGLVHVDSAPGAGTTVRLLIPLPTAQVDPADAPALQPASAPRLKLLLVDDDPQLLDALAEVLRGEGHTVESVSGGAQALQVLSRAARTGQRYDLVITDLDMPEVDGIRVAREAKALQPHVPVVMLSGWGQRPAEGGGLPEHVDLLLDKPPRLTELRAMALRFSHFGADASASQADQTAG